MRQRLFAFLLALILPLGAHAQTQGLTIWKPVTGSHLQGIGATAASITTAFFHGQAIRVTCTVNCWLAFRITNATYPATLATGHYLPANIPAEFKVAPQSTLSVIATTNGTVYVTELSQ